MRAFLKILIKTLGVTVLVSVGFFVVQSFNGVCFAYHGKQLGPCSLSDNLPAAVFYGAMFGLVVGIVLALLVFLGFRAIHYFAGASPGDDV